MELTKENFKKALVLFLKKNKIYYKYLAELYFDSYLCYSKKYVEIEKGKVILLRYLENLSPKPISGKLPLCDTKRIFDHTLNWDITNDGWEFWNKVDISFGAYFDETFNL